jgi:hypothetical protein
MCLMGSDYHWRHVRLRVDEEVPGHWPGWKALKRQEGMRGLGENILSVSLIGRLDDEGLVGYSEQGDI